MVVCTERGDLPGDDSEARTKGFDEGVVSLEEDKSHRKEQREGRSAQPE